MHNTVWEIPYGPASAHWVRYLGGPVIFVGPDEIGARTIAGLYWVRGCVFHFPGRRTVVSSLWYCPEPCGEAVISHVRRERWVRGSVAAVPCGGRWGVRTPPMKLWGQRNYSKVPGPLIKTPMWPTLKIPCQPQPITALYISVFLTVCVSVFAAVSRLSYPFLSLRRKQLLHLSHWEMPDLLQKDTAC